MKNKTLSLLMILVFTMTLILGSSITVFADESTSISDEEYFYDGNIKNSDGKYVYNIYNFTGKDSKGNGYINTATLVSTAPLVCVRYQDSTCLEKQYKYIIASGYTLYTDGSYSGTNGWYSWLTTIESITNRAHSYVDENKKPYWTSTDSSDYNNVCIDFANGGVYTSNIPIFTTFESANNYLNTLDDSDVVNREPSVNNSFYLKNIGYSVRAEDSSENPDETYIKFTWDTDNLQEGDLLEVKTKNHYTKIGGDQVIGFHDYITSNNGVDCYSGSYEMSQTDAVKAWFETVENKPLVFKDYDTDIYFLRPVRGNQYGLWTKVTMGRKGFLFGTPTSSPYIKDIEYGVLDDNGDWSVSDDVTTAEGGNHGIDQGGNILTPSDITDTKYFDSPWELIKYLFSNLSNLINYFAELPLLINTVIGWLPNPIIVLICGSIALVIILRIFGR